MGSAQLVDRKKKQLLHASTPTLASNHSSHRASLCHGTKHRGRVNRNKKKQREEEEDPRAHDRTSVDSIGALHLQHPHRQ